MSTSYKSPLAKSIIPSQDGLRIILDDRDLFIPWAVCSERLAHANERERITLELSPGGYGIHWTLLDEDLSIRGLINALDAKQNEQQQ
jgi:hypothetical protein